MGFRSTPIPSGLAAAVALAVLAGAPPAQASAVTSLDEFTIVRSGVPTSPLGVYDGGRVFYRDGFGDGTEPPAGGQFFDGSPGGYNVLGHYASGAEAGGRLVLDSSLGGPFVNAGGGGRTLQRSTLHSDVDPTTAAGLKRDFHTFAIYGLFGLAAPVVAGDGYGIALADGSALPATTSLDLLVRREGSGALVVRFQEQDFVGGVIDTLELDELSAPAGADQIELRLQRASLADNVVTAAYRFWDDGVPLGDFTSMTASTEFFRHNGFARANFFAVQASLVPEPSTLALAVLPLAAAAAIGRRRPAAAGPSAKA